MKSDKLERTLFLLDNESSKLSKAALSLRGQAAKFFSEDATFVDRILQL